MNSIDTTYDSYQDEMVAGCFFTLSFAESLHATSLQEHASRHALLLADVDARFREGSVLLIQLADRTNQSLTLRAELRTHLRAIFIASLTYG